MSPEELKARARRLPQELLTQGDLAVAGEIFAPGCVPHGLEPVMPGSGDPARWITTLRRAFPDLRATVEEELAEDNRVALQLAVAGTHRGPFLGVPPTGTRVTWPLVVILHAGPDGAFTGCWATWDWLDLLRQLGAAPTALAPP